MFLNRRELLIGAAAAAVPKTAAAQNTFSFVHLTDTHIEPELHAADGCRMAFDRVNKLRPDFIIHGGDLVFDAAAVPDLRAKQVYTLFEDTSKRLEAPVHHLVGNHDVCGVGTGTRYGKAMFEDRIGKRYYSFAHKGWKFIALDSIYTADTAKGFIGKIDDEQVAWLKTELAATPKTQPLVVATHIPLATGFLQFSDPPANAEKLVVTNSSEVLNLLFPYNLKAVLQGHTHIRETIVYNGCQFITSGAVCGNWWKGLRMGHPEGFGVLTVKGDQIAWRYETYGFHADPS
jgi:3',5'-cyclic AMP phosphodiesterase CpdA